MTPNDSHNSKLQGFDSEEETEQQVSQEDPLEIMKALTSIAAEVCPLLTLKPKASS